MHVKNLPQSPPPVIFVSIDNIPALRTEIEDLFRDVREVLDLDVDDPEWGAPNLEQQYEWTLEALYNPPRGLRWALALAHVGLGNFDTHSFAWWLRSISEIREK